MPEMSVIEAIKVKTFFATQPTLKIVGRESSDSGDHLKFVDDSPIPTSGFC